MVVTVDGETVLSTLVESRRQWGTYDTGISVPDGTHQLTVGFANNRKARGCDHDLRVDRIDLSTAPSDPGSGGDPGSGDPAKPTCDGSLQALVDAASPGATVNVPGGCVYRETVVVREPVTLIGGAGAEIRGSDVWSNWTTSGAAWVSAQSLPALSSGGRCKTGTERCQWPEQVFFDGEPLEQVASDPSAGQFAVDASRRVVLADDPNGRVVEVSVRPFWIEGRAANVTIEGFTMKHAANSDFSGAIKNNGHDNWTVKGNDLSWAHGSNLALGDAVGLRAENNDIHHGGRVGMSSAGAALEVVGNEIHDNNTEDFEPSWAAAGMKVTAAQRLIVEDNEVYANDWNGIWVDRASENVTLSNNRVHHNLKYGMHLEISDRAEIQNNVVWENGWGVTTSSAGIVLVASRDVQVYDNTLAWNASGVLVVNSQREKDVGGTDPIFDTVSDVHIHHNALLAKDYPNGERMALVWRKAWSGGNIYEPAADNRGYDNRYWYPASEGTRKYRFLWDGKKDTLGEFNDTPGEEQADYLSSAEKDRILASKNIPATPER